MKKKYIPTEETEVTEEVEVVEKEESEMGFFKKNWKKFAVGAGVALAGIAGYVLGSNTGNDDDYSNLIEYDAAEEAEESSKE